MNKLLIIDGMLLHFQMYYGMPNRFYSHDRNKYPYPIHSIVGFVGAVLKMIKLIDPTHLVIVFDGEIANDRQELDPDYKANRIDYSQVELDLNPFACFELLKTILKHLNICFFETVDAEADDYIAYLTKTIPIDCVVSSLDKDLLQLITNRCQVLRYRGKLTKIYDQKLFITEYGFKPSYLADYKAIFGDPSDNIKKVPGCGKITTTRLIKEYHTIENIYDNIDQIHPIRIRNQLINHQSRVFINKNLVTFKTNLGYRFNLDQFIIDQNLKQCKIMSILKELEIL